MISNNYETCKNNSGSSSASKQKDGIMYLQGCHCVFPSWEKENFRIRRTETYLMIKDIHLRVLWKLTTFYSLSSLFKYLPYNDIKLFRLCLAPPFYWLKSYCKIEAQNESKNKVEIV